MVYVLCPGKKRRKKKGQVYLQLTKWRQHLLYIRFRFSLPALRCRCTRVLCTNYVTFSRRTDQKRVHMSFGVVTSLVVTLFHAHLSHLFSHDGVLHFLTEIMKEENIFDNSVVIFCPPSRRSALYLLGKINFFPRLFSTFFSLLPANSIRSTSITLKYQQLSIIILLLLRLYTMYTLSGRVYLYANKS